MDWESCRSPDVPFVDANIVGVDNAEQRQCSTMTATGCAIGGIMYADDLVIISPSVKGLQRLLDICAVYGQTHDILFNDEKTVCMFIPAKSSFYINTPAVFLKRRRLSFTVKYKYLGTLITHDGSDEANMSRQRGLFALCESYAL